MSDELWGWLLVVAEFVGIAAMSLLVGRRKLWWGWLVVFVCVSVPWLAYSVTTARWSFLVLSIFWAAVHLSNAHQWRSNRDMYSGSSTCLRCDNRR